jgi:transposase InsO family protein
VSALEYLLDAFPFKVINFHSDNGSEYVNKNVAKLLGKLLIEFTKSRPRQPNDNALAEGKKQFEYKNMMTLYEKLKSIEDAPCYLKDGVTFKQLDDIAYAMTDNEAADLLQRERKLLFKLIHEDCQKRA